MIDRNNLKFSDWSTERKMEALKLMEKSIWNNGDMLAHDTIWKDWGAGLCATAEETVAKRKAIAEDDEKFINALFCYYICMTTDFKWVEGN